LRKAKAKRAKTPEATLTIIAKKEGKNVHFDIKTDNKGLTMQELQEYLFQAICGLQEYLLKLRMEEEESNEIIRKEFSKQIKEVERKKQQGYVR
jgi:hypothetical protein